MNATIVDLRYKMREIIRALDRGECITVFYHGKQKGILSPYKAHSQQDIKKHALFGMYSDDKQSVKDIMKKLRRGRYRDI